MSEGPYTTKLAVETFGGPVEPCSMHEGEHSGDCAVCAIPVRNLGRFLHEWAVAFGLQPADAVRLATMAVAHEATEADVGAKQFGRLALDTYRALERD